MSLKALFIITAIIAIVFGVLFVIIPTQTYFWYGISSDTALNYMGQLFGAALIAVGLISWQSRNAADSDARKAIILSFFIADGIGFIIALIGQLNNVINRLGWLTVIIYFLLSLGFAYFQFSKPKVAES
jgi:hypothetical protein